MAQAKKKKRGKAGYKSKSAPKAKIKKGALRGRKTSPARGGGRSPRRTKKTVRSAKRTYRTKRR
tara:strand:+ start:550 stop:741 length:192 start_codon:yes stop_codon:yes gene_type:complete